jgi:hypothetical protein
MVRIGKPDSITITINDRKAKKSKSITVYNKSLEEAYELIKRAFEPAKEKRKV